jgi:hypothetical protein
MCCGAISKAFAFNPCHAVGKASGKIINKILFTCRFVS